MGSFYTNISIKCEENSKIQESIKENLSTGYIISKEGWKIICSNEFEQNMESAVEIMNIITDKIKSIGIVFLNHDDDVLSVAISTNGATIFNYNSDPGYFSGDDNGPEISNLKSLVDYGIIKNHFEFNSILTADFTFAFERHEKICRLLNFPIISVGTSCEYISSGELPIDVNENEIIEI